MPKKVNSLWFIVNSFRKISKILATTNQQPFILTKEGRTTNKHQKRPGFMFIDLLLTLLFATTLIILLLVTATTLTQTFKSNLQSIATRIATKKIEDLRKTSYSSLPTNGYFSDPDLIKLPSGSANLTMVNYLSSVDIKQATITVNWIQNEAPKQIIINTLIYKNGI